MKNKYYLFTGFILLHIVVHAQVKIGDNSTTINSASLLELETTNKGFVLPRVSLTDVSSSSPLASGLLTSTIVYNTNATATGGSGTGIYYWDGSKWNFLTNTTTSLNYWTLTGNSGTSASTNFIGTTDAVDLVVKTNNATRMRIKSNTGFIGINTTAPSERLHVVGNFYLNGAFMPGGSAGTSGYILTSAGAGTSPTWTNPNSLAWTLTGNSGTSASTNFIGTTDVVDFVEKTNNTERLRITSGGNVGIGLSNPSYALSVLSASNPLYLSGVQATSTLSSDSVVTINAGIIKKTPYSSISNSFWGLTGNAGTNASTNFIGTTDAIDFVAKTNNTERIRILGAANGSSKAGWIGMGVTIPRSSLDVTGNYTNKNVITIQNTSNSGYSSVDMLDDAGTLKGTFGYGNSGTGTFFGSRDYFSTYGSDFVFNTTSGTFNLFMKGSTGNIGINTGSPGAALDVNGNFKLGANGSVLNNIYKTSTSVTISSLTGLFTVTRTVAVANAPLNSTVVVNPQAALPTGVSIAYSYVSSANNVTIGFIGLLAVASTPINLDITVIY